MAFWESYFLATADCIPPGPLAFDPALEMPGFLAGPRGKTGDLLERDAVDPYSRLAGL